MSDSNRAAAANAWVEVDFSPDPGYQLLFDGLHGHEELGRPFLYDIDLSSGTLHGDIGNLVGSSAKIWLAQSDENAQDRYIHGIVTRVISSGMVAGAYRYRVEIRPWIWLLTRVTDCIIFQKKSAFDIITKLFRDAGFSDFDDRRQAGAGDAVLEYCVQYHETSFDFVTRLMEQFGLYYYFKHESTKHTLVIADDPNAHDTLTDAIPFVFDQTEFRTVGDHIWEWQTDFALHSGKFTYQDYNFTTPAADLTAKTVKAAPHPNFNSLEVYEYPGLYEAPADGVRLTDVRMQAISMNRAVVKAASNTRGLRAGWRFTLKTHPEASTNRDYLVIRTELSMAIAEGSSTVAGETMDTYRVILHAIPGDVPFRLARLTNRTLIRGPQTARVVGESGDEITTDEYGRVKVKFHWDRSETADDQRTCWIRVAQTSAGAGWGSMFIPRVGQEVVVEFLEGNPDRPLITGVVYNANMTVPYALPDNKTRSTVKTSSSKGGSGFNELRFEDKAGEEEVFFQAQFDYNKVVLNNETVKIKKDTTTTVEEGNRKVTVAQGNDELSVTTGDRSVTVTAGNHKVTVSAGNDTLTVSAGNHTISVSAGKSEITAAQSITLSVGANSVKIDTSGVTINGVKVGVQASASMSLQAGAPMSLSAPMISLN